LILAQESWLLSPAERARAGRLVGTGTEFLALPGVGYVVYLAVI
jgi:hypothetical protein